VNGARLIEERHREFRHLLRMFRPVVAPVGELEHAAAAARPDTIRLRDLFAMRAM